MKTQKSHFAQDHTTLRSSFKVSWQDSQAHTCIHHYSVFHKKGSNIIAAFNNPEALISNHRDSSTIFNSEYSMPHNEYLDISIV
jgi:hypothetical protein